MVGIVTARLPDAATFKATGLMPQNVNYAMKCSYALLLLDSMPELSRKLKAPHPTKERKFEDVVQQARDAVALVLVY